jgi:hypothetical protein
MEHAEKVFEIQKGHGFYDTNHQCKIIVMISVGMLLERLNLTGSELTAIVLHEIGHNFDDWGYAKPNELMKEWLEEYGMQEAAVVYNNRIKMYNYNQDKKKYDAIYDSQMKRDKDRAKYNRNSENAEADSEIVLSVGLGLTIENLKGILLSPFKQIKNLSETKGEEFADSFAAMYGYGPELISSFRKMNAWEQSFQPSQSSKKDTIIRNFKDLMCEIYITMYDVHGTDQARCKKLIIKIEHDIKSGDYPPDLKDDLLQELDGLKSEYNQIINSGPGIIRRWRQFVSIVFRGNPNITKFVPRHQM